jgi:hypothetical protein
METLQRRSGGLDTVAARLDARLGKLRKEGMLMVIVNTTGLIEISRHVGGFQVSNAGG